MKYLHKIWRFITYVRMGLANIIFLLIILAIVAVIFAPGTPPLPAKAPLVVSLSGVLVDQKTLKPSVFDLLQERQDEAETVVRDIITVIDHAADDERVTTLILNVNRLRGGSFSKLEEIGQSIENFKESGKPVFAVADSYSQSQYFLASYADTIYLNKMGNLAITGFGYFGSYFKEAADKLSLKFHLFKVGDYKDAAEPYVRNDMSEASREHNSSWISELWGRYTSKVESNRELPSGAVEAFISAWANPEKKLQEDFSILAKNAGLVDEILSRVEIDKQFTEKFGKEKDSDYFTAIYHQRYLAEIQPTLPRTEGNIGLIVATGTIVDGFANDGKIGGNSMSALIRQARDDESLNALVIRIDSGGGSAFASDVIREEIAATRAQGLPVYISMGSVAASGGYWIAMAADELWALPSTITGSIGVWGLVPNITESMKRIGVHNDGFGTTELSDIYNIDRPLSPQAQHVIQSGVDNIYRQFINLVAVARDKTPEDVHQIAQGRVWTGEKALELGLVDSLGTLNDLFQSVSDKLKLQEFNVKLITKPLSPTEQFLEALMNQASGFGIEVRQAMLGDNLGALVKAAETSGLSHAFAPSGNTPGAINTPIHARCLSCLVP